MLAAAAAFPSRAGSPLSADGVASSHLHHRRMLVVASASSPSSNTLSTSSRRSAMWGMIAVGSAAITTLPVPSATAAMEDEEPENNGWWLTGLLPTPAIANGEIANKETGSRRFVRKGIYMAKLGPEGCSFRLRQCAFDLLALGDMIDSASSRSYNYDDDDRRNQRQSLVASAGWNYVNKYLRLKSTFMYYDFDTVISNSTSADEKRPLLALANHLFDNIEKLEEAIEKHDDVNQIESLYQGVTPFLHEVRAIMV